MTMVILSSLPHITFAMFSFSADASRAVSVNVTGGYLTYINIFMFGFVMRRKRTVLAGKNSGTGLYRPAPPAIYYVYFARINKRSGRP